MRLLLLLGNLEWSNKIQHSIHLTTRKIPVIRKIYPAFRKLVTKYTWISGFKIKKYKGFYMLLERNTAIGKFIGIYGGHELEQTKFFFESIKNFDAFFDIGANVGLYTLEAAHRGIKEINSFEPDFRNVNSLHTNLLVNEFDDVNVFDIALSDKIGFVDFVLEIDKKTDMSRVKTVQDNNLDTVKVKTATLDSMFDCKGKKLAIKIDVEGHEQSVIKGSESILKNNQCFIQCEVWAMNYKTIQEVFEKLGYREIKRISNDSYFINF